MLKIFSNADIINAIGTIFIPIILGCWAWAQWNADRKIQAQITATENARATRQRDGQLTEWAMRVVELMAELEAVCTPKDNAKELADTIAWRASALVDQGRLFFPNVDSDADPSGLRPKLLDEVIRATYVAKALTNGTVSNLDLLRRHTYSARRRFIALMQSKTNDSLYRGMPDDAGDSIPKNPELWPAPDKIGADFFLTASAASPAPAKE